MMPWNWCCSFGIVNCSPPIGGIMVFPCLARSFPHALGDASGLSGQRKMCSTVAPHRSRCASCLPPPSAGNKKQHVPTEIWKAQTTQHSAHGLILNVWWRLTECSKLKQERPKNLMDQCLLQIIKHEGDDVSNYRRLRSLAW